MEPFESNQRGILDSPLSQFLFKHSPIPAALIGTNGTLQRTNDSFKNLVQQESNTSQESNIRQFIHPEDQDRFNQYFSKQLVRPNSSKLSEIRFLCDGNSFVARTTLSGLQMDEDSPYLVLQVEALTEKEKIQKEREAYLKFLSNYKEKLEKAEFSLENTQVGVAWADEESRVAYTNRAYAEMAGIEKDQLVGMRVVDFREYFDKESWKKHWEEMYKLKHKVMELEFPSSSPGGMAMPVELSTSLTEFNGIPYTVTYFRDISIRKKHLKKLEQQNREMEQFTYAASHDLQGPLKTIKNYIKLLKEEFGKNLDSEAHTYLDVIFNSAHRMKILTNHLLDFSRLGQKRDKTVVDCAEILRDLQVDLQASLEESDAQLVVGPLPKLIGFETEFRLLFQNLIMNAIKFRKKDFPPIVTIQAYEEVNNWIFSVADNGIGIEEAHQERIFGIFQRLHSRKTYEGTGIGLAHCRKIAELHEGSIWVESQLGEGSTFYIQIPKVNQV